MPRDAATVGQSPTLGAMGYYPDPNPRKVNGCLESLLLTKIAFQVLAPALALIFGALAALVLVVWAFSTSPWLGLGSLAVVGALIWLVSLWDKRRVRDFEMELNDPSIPKPPKPPGR